MGMGLTRLTASTCWGLPAYSLRHPASPGRMPCLLTWQISHCLTLRRTSRPMLGQYHRSCNLVSTLWTPTWACWCASRTNSRLTAAGQTTLFLSGCLLWAAKVMVSRPSGPICRESQRWQYSRNSAHPCLSFLSLGHRPSILARYMPATTPGRFSWSSCSSLTLPAKTGLARRFCTISGGVPAFCWSWPWSQSYSFHGGPLSLFLSPNLLKGLPDRDSLCHQRYILTDGSI